MNKEEFQKKLSVAKEVTLIGPMLKKLPESANHPFIYVDRGVHFRSEIVKLAGKDYRDLSVGDGDSSDYPLDILLPREKNYSDFKFALELLSPEVKRINLLGFLEGRLDHEFLNFGEVHHSLLNHLPNALFSFEEKVFGKNKGSLKLAINGNFSVIVFQKTEVKIQGKCKYPLPTFTELLPLSSVGLSNLGEGDVIIEGNAPFFVFKD